MVLVEIASLVRAQLSGLQAAVENALDLARHGLHHKAEWVDAETQYGILLFHR